MHQSFLYTVLQQRDAGLLAGFAGGVVPDACLHLTDVGAAQQQHTQAALADAAADGVGQLAVQHCLVESKKRRAFEFFTLPSSFFTYSQALKLISKPFTLCVKAPTEMKSTPCSA